MSKIEEILQSELKPKEKIGRLAEEISKNNKLIAEIVKCFENVSAGDQGNLIESLEHVSQKNPEMVASYIDFVLGCLNNKAPRIKWEAARTIANLAKQFSDDASKAIPALLKNTGVKGTVVRWSTALALGEIAKYNREARKQLLPAIEKIMKNETGNGVKNVYLKALKVIGKEK